MKALIAAAISGTIWAALAALILSNQNFWGRVHDVRWLACLAGPLIGLGIYWCSRWSYHQRNAIRVLWSFVSVYLAAGVYGIVLGLLTWRSRGPNVTIEAIFEPALACFWGITFVPIFWVLFGLSHLNHQLISELERSA